MAQPEVPDWIGLYLQEDLAGIGDITSDPVFPPEMHGRARVVARERGFLAGAARAAEVFDRLGVANTQHMNDGSWVDAGDVVLEVEGPTRGILAAERSALNLLGRMMGVATTTRRIMETLAAECSAARVAATRKTTPGFRVFEKEAVAIAGGDPHRAGLWDAAMIKDNHREAAGDLAAAIHAIRAAHPDAPITVEVETKGDALLAARKGADWILIDNQAPDVGRAWAEAAWGVRPELKVEASGGITEEVVADYGWADRISMGPLTNAARSIDVSLEWGA